MMNASGSLKLHRFFLAAALLYWFGPPIKEFSFIESVLGTEIHDAVFHGKPARQALRDAENRIYEGVHLQS